MKRLAAAARGEILIFTDANVVLAEDAIDRLVAYYGDPSIGGVCGTLRYLPDEDSVTASVGSAYWSLDEKLRTLESRTGNVMGADGSIFSIRRDLYPAFPDTVLDDLTVSMSVIFKGLRLIKADDVVAYERSVAKRSEELRRKVRIGARAYHTHAFLRPQLRAMSPLDRFKYSSRKLLRWFGGLFLAGFALFGLLAVLSAAPAVALALAAAGGAFLLMATRMRSGFLARVGEIILATFATLVGVIQGMRGKVVMTWAPAKSR
jgi:cellulose synthase/poly-beta-1,6-N-acetylglucosamine synthase-like glycosyltransferase